MKKLSTRIMIGYINATLILVTSIVFFTYQTIKTNYYNSSIKELATLNKSLQMLFVEDLKGLQKEIEQKEFKDQLTIDTISLDNIFLTSKYVNLSEKIIKIANKLNTRITIVDENGFVYFDSKEHPSKMENHLNRPEIFSAINVNYGQSTRYSNTLKKEMLYVAYPIRINEKTRYILRTSFLLKNIDNLLRELIIEISKISLIIIILSMFAVLAFTRKVVKPLNQLSFASRKIASGDFDLNLKIKGYKEIIELTDNFNAMTRKLKKSFDKVNIQKERLNALISNLSEGIVVINTKNEITLFNSSFQKIVKNNDLTRKKIFEIIENVHFLDFLNNLKSSGNLNLTNNTLQLKIEDNYFLVSGSFIDIKEEVILVFTDISEIQKLQIFKKDLVANASHELRTPLTAIKGFIETLEEESEGDIKYYAQIINRHTDRLINLVSDLLTLSELENFNNILDKNSINLSNLIIKIIVIFENKLKSKNITISVNIDNQIECKCDEFRIEQVIINLIDNAIKYNDIGQKLIINVEIINQNQIYNKFDVENINEIKNLNMSESITDFILLQFIDFGNGIPDADKKRVFERFYTVDKSRARQLGGTGLGLSIVKHIINLHNGIIFVENNKPKGSIFNIILPK